MSDEQPRVPAGSPQGGEWTGKTVQTWDLYRDGKKLNPMPVSDGRLMDFLAHPKFKGAEAIPAGEHRLVRDLTDRQKAAILGNPLDQHRPGGSKTIMPGTQKPGPYPH